MQYTCPQCKHMVPVDRNHDGAMILCKNCYVLFPTPNLTPEMPPAPPVKVRAEPERLDIELIAKRFGDVSSWRLVDIGLGLVQVSTVVILVVASLTAFLIVLDVLTGAFLYPWHFFLVLPGAVALGAFLCAFIGVCLCWNAPVAQLRVRVRAGVVLFLSAAVCQAGIWLLNVGLGWNKGNGAVYLVKVLLVSGSLLAAFICWLLFLQKAADCLQNDRLSFRFSDLLATSIFPVPVAVCGGFTGLTSIPGDAHWFAFVAFCVYVGFLFFSLWHFRLVSLLRQIIPRRNVG
jgi:hypothetical protein